MSGRAGQPDDEPERRGNRSNNKVAMPARAAVWRGRRGAALALGRWDETEVVVVSTDADGAVNHEQGLDKLEEWLLLPPRCRVSSWARRRQPLAAGSGSVRASRITASWRPGPTWRPARGLGQALVSPSQRRLLRFGAS